MRVAYLDCFSGVAGDMFLGALIDAGLPLEELEGELAKLGMDEFRLEATRTRRRGLDGIRLEVVTPEDAKPPHRGLGDIKTILAGSGLRPETKDQASRVFTRLAEAEAQVHGVAVEEVRFHEVGAVDAIVDVVGTVAGLALLGVEELHCSRITLGRGLARCAHGDMPVPVPATVELLKEAPVIYSDIEGELVTPTGAALVASLASSIGSGYSFAASAVGYGFGSRVREEGPPNALRLILGDSPDEYEEVVVLETNLDDATGQMVGFLLERVLNAGALDAYAIPIQMKKSRPGMLFSAITDEGRADSIERIIFGETTTLGVRRHRTRRTKLERKSAPILTSLGEVNTKFARGPGGIRRAAPEYEDVARIAAERELSFRQAMQIILRELPVWPAEGEGQEDGGELDGDDR